MNPKVLLGARILLGLFMVVFGANKFAGFIPDPELDGEALAYFMSIGNAHVLDVVGVFEIITGLMFISGRYMGLALIINAPMAFNALLFHITLDPAGSGGAAVWSVLCIVVFIGIKDKFREILKP